MIISIITTYEHNIWFSSAVTMMGYEIVMRNILL